MTTEKVVRSAVVTSTKVLVPQVVTVRLTVTYEVLADDHFYAPVST